LGPTIAALIASEQILLAREKWDSSALLASGATAFAESIGAQLEPLEHELHSRSLEVLESKLSREAFEAATAAGAALDRDGLIRFALEALE
jgi:hypothetical protein